MSDRNGGEKNRRTDKVVGQNFENYLDNFPYVQGGFQEGTKYPFLMWVANGNVVLGIIINSLLAREILDSDSRLIGSSKVKALLS